MSKISYGQYLEMARDVDVSDEDLLAYSVVVRGEGAFDYELRADSNKVEMSSEDEEFESAMRIGNGLARFRRQARFRKQLSSGTDLPVLVSEGDSWFQFPFLVKEVIDRLEDDYLIWSVGAAGDTAENMVFGKQRRGRTEYMKALRKQEERVRGFLFSAAGNDIIGEDPETKEPVLLDLLKDFNGNETDIEGHIDLPLLDEKLAFLRGAYETVIANIRAEPKFETLPILVHGYDYVFPFPWGDDDKRNPIYAAKNEWLGKPLDERNIRDKDQRRNILKFMIDKLYVMLEDVAGDASRTHVWLVDCRGALPSVGDWNDEIHGTSRGFKKVADRFRHVLEKAIAVQATV